MATNVALIVAAVVIVAALVYYFDGDRSMLASRREYRRDMAGKVVSLAGKLDGHQLWIALPFPELQLDPKAFPEGWEEHPRRWARVLGADGSALILDGEDRIEALGCEWYVYADAAGKSVDAVVTGHREGGEYALPPGIDPESLFPSDVLFSKTPE